MEATLTPLLTSVTVADLQQLDADSCTEGTAARLSAALLT